MGGRDGARGSARRRSSYRRGSPRMSRRAGRSSASSRTSRRVVEGLSIDEAFLDVHGMERSVGTPIEIARRLRAQVRVEVGLPITVGIARTKFLAKVASAVAKPDGLLVVPPDGELEFLHPLPVERLWGVGPVTARKLRDRGITTVRQVALLPEPALVAMLGQASGRHLHALAHNRDPRPVQHRRRRGSIGSQRARGRRPWTHESLDADLVGLVDRVTRRMRRPTGSGAPSSCGFGSTTTLVRRGRSRCAVRRRERWRSSPPRASSSSSRCRCSARRVSPWSGSR